MWAVLIQFIAVSLLLVVLKPEFKLPKFSQRGLDYEVKANLESLPISRESVQTVSISEILELRQLLHNEKFEKLNDILDDYQKNFEADSADEYRVIDAYIAFEITDPAKEIHFSKWKESTPSHYQPYLASAVYYYRKGWEGRGHQFASETSEEDFEIMRINFSKASENIEKALKINNNLLVAYNTLIGIHNADSNFNNEKEIIKKALTLFPNSYAIRTTCAWASEPRWGGNYTLIEKIARDAEKVSYQNPRLTALYGAIYYDQGIILAADKKYDEAINRFTKAITFGDDGSFYKARARINYHYLKNENQALEDINRAIEIRPTNETYYLLRSKMYFSTKDYDLALYDIKVAEHILPNKKKLENWKEWAGNNLVYSGHQQYKANDYQGAIYTYDLAIQFNDQNHEAFYRRGMTSYKENDMETAISFFDQAIGINQQHFESFAMMDYLLSREKQFEEIISYWDLFIEMDTENAKAYLSRGRAHYHNRDKESALSDVEIACDLGSSEGCKRLQSMQ